MLQALGLTDLEESAYRALVGVPSATPHELAEFPDDSMKLGPESSRPPLSEVLAGDASRAGHVLARLEALGLASRSASESDRYVAVPPQLGLNSLLVSRQADLQRAEAELGRLTVAYRGATVGRTAPDVVDVVHGPSAVGRRLTQMQGGAVDEVVALVTTPTVAVSPEENLPVEMAAIGRGVSYRIVLASDVLKQPGASAILARSLAAGERVRVTSHVPVKLFISDRRLALVELADRSQADVVGALLVHPSGLLDALIAVFEMTWDQARPLEPSDTARADLSPIERQIVSLLAAGLTDRSVAAQLGVSERSVQRHVRAVMDRVEAQSRLELGWHAARAGWF
jgi:DNA-binding CsgD family transcriptional regulator/sugar-specific transcriptional regulator TrmB